MNSRDVNDDDYNCITPMSSYAHEASLGFVVELQLVSPFCVVVVVLAPLTLLLQVEFTPLLPT